MIKLDTTWVSSHDSFAALATTWNSLAALTDDKSIFLRHEWFAAAWQWRSGDCSLAILCVRRNSEIVGILPMVMEGRHSYSMTSRGLTSLDLPDTQEFSLLCASNDASAIAESICTELDRTAKQRDWLQLRKLGPTVPNTALLQALSRCKRVSIVPADACACVGLDEPWDAYYARRSRRLKKGNNLIANKLKAAFRNVEVKRVILDPSPAGAEVLDALCDLSKSSWKKELDVALYKANPRKWADAMRQSLGASGNVYAWTLYLDGVLAAAELQLERSGIVSALRADTREEFDKYGTGTFLGWKVLEALMNGERVLYNMGPGLNEYKERWAEKRVDLSMANVFSPTITGRLLWSIDYRLKPLAKKIADVMPRAKQS